MRDKLEPKIPYDPYKVSAQTAKAVIRLHRCAVWSQPLLFAYEIKKTLFLFCVVAQFTLFSLDFPFSEVERLLHRI